MGKYLYAPLIKLYSGHCAQLYIDTSLLYTHLKRFYLKNVNKNHSKATHTNFYLTHHNSQKSLLIIKHIEVQELFCLEKKSKFLRENKEWFCLMNHSVNTYGWFFINTSKQPYNKVIVFCFIYIFVTWKLNNVVGHINF